VWRRRPTIRPFAAEEPKEETMAKGQMRSTKEAKKPKSSDKKEKKVPTYMMNEMSASRPAPGAKGGPKK
jgi:hypothetical protein